MDYITQDDIRAVIREDGECTRRHIDAAVEAVREDLRRIAQAQQMLLQTLSEMCTELRADLALVDRRLARLEARRA